ncbi:MAG: aminotransferase class V-fold PLP-dependent enzyme [Candidatus Bathyarchaeia archaeon]
MQRILRFQSRSPTQLTSTFMSLLIFGDIKRMERLWKTFVCKANQRKNRGNSPRRKHGAYLIVDAIQSAGAIPIDVKKDDVDFLATACYKWLLSPPGAGYLYVKEELIERFEPPFVGWASVKQEIFDTIDFWDIWSLKLADTASRFEIGSPSFISFVGAKEALKMLLNFGIENVERRIINLTDHLIETVKGLGLELQTPEERQYRSGIVNFKIDKPREITRRLVEKCIIVSARAHGIRVSPHFYNTKEEIDKLVEEVRKSIAKT